MTECKFKIKHYDYIFNEGYPILIVTIGDFEKPGNVLIELIEIFMNYNKTDHQFRYNYIPISNFLDAGLTIEDCMEWGFDYLKEVISERILNSDQSLKKNALPLREKKISSPIFYRMIVSPSFQKIKNEILNNSFCIELKKEFKKHEMIDFSIK